MKQLFAAILCLCLLAGCGRTDSTGNTRFDPKIRVVIEGAEFADYFWPAVEQYVECTLVNFRKTCEIRG